MEEGAFVKENFDELCWTLTAKKNYKPDRNGNSVVSHQDAFKLWCLFNFLSEDKYPLVMVPDEVGPMSPPIPVLPGLCVLAEPHLWVTYPTVTSWHVPLHPARCGAPGNEREEAGGGTRELSALGTPTVPTATHTVQGGEGDFRGETPSKCGSLSCLEGSGRADLAVRLRGRCHRVLSPCPTCRVLKVRCQPKKSLWR